MAGDDDGVGLVLREFFSFFFGGGMFVGVLVSTSSEDFAGIVWGVGLHDSLSVYMCTQRETYTHARVSYAHKRIYTRAYP